MKLWKRRPLSEDLSRKDLQFTDEMPPSLVYISPGNHKISKRTSLRINDYSENFQNPLELNSFQVVENRNNFDNKNVIGNYRFKSFLDYEFKNTIKFDDNSLKSSNLSNRDCKSYFLPVSQEWSPVKGVMKICRSASVPFRSRNSLKTDIQETNVIPNNKSQLSLSEKIKVFFRNRSTSRPPKQTLTSITEAQPAKCSINPDKGLNRTSRSRMKEMESCNSLYEPSRALNNEFCQQLNNAIKKNNSRVDSNFNKSFSSKQILTNKENKSEEKKFHLTKDKAERKPYILPESQKRTKTKSLNPELNQRVSLREFSSSVVSHTTSSAAKCKSNSPKTPETDHSYYRKNRHLDRKYVKKSGELVASNFIKKPDEIYNSPDFENSDLPLSYKPPQAMITAISDKKIANLPKTDLATARSARFYSKGCKQKSEHSLNCLVVPAMNCSEHRPALIDQLKYNNVDEDDYVTLAKVNMPSSLNSAFMTQSLYVSISPEFSSIRDKYENIEINAKNMYRNLHQKEMNFHKNNPRLFPVGGEIRKRPISCMAVVNADFRIPVSDSEKNTKQGYVYPKSPYLSQYSKLYSLRRNDMEFIHRHNNEIADADIMTRSQHSGHSKMCSLISKDQIGKLSIDSGLVDDINAFHSDDVQQTQNY